MRVLWCVLLLSDGTPNGKPDLLPKEAIGFVGLALGYVSTLTLSPAARRPTWANSKEVQSHCGAMSWDVALTFFQTLKYID